MSLKDFFPSIKEDYLGRIRFMVISLSVSKTILTEGTKRRKTVVTLTKMLLCVHVISVHTWKHSFHLQRDWVAVVAALVLHHQVIRSRILNVGLIDVKRCEITIFALILCNIINSKSACREKRKIMLRVIIVIDFVAPSCLFTKAKSECFLYLCRLRPRDVMIPTPTPHGADVDRHTPLGWVMLIRHV